MAKPKKGALHQLLVVMVDATDFASVESAITESDFNSGVTKKFYGVNTGGSAATTSGTISKTASLVRSGVFRVTLKTSENNYDKMMARFAKTGCAEQIYEWDNVDNDDSDLMSVLTVIQSMASDAASAAIQGNSRVLLNQSRISDIASYLVAMSGVQSDIYSLLSDLDSNFSSRVPKRVATDSQLSDLASDLRSVLIVNQSGVSDLYSLLSDLESNFASRVPKRVATDSQLSDLASDVKSAVIVVQSMASDAASAAQQGNSRVLVVQSMASDVYSLLSDFQSDFASRVPKRVATDSQLSNVHSDLRSQVSGITAVVSASDISDIASHVWAHTVGARVDSRVLLNQSRISDVYSMLSDLESNFSSRVPKLVATNSQLSDLHSDLKSHLAVSSGVQSDLYSLLSDLESNFGSRVPKRVATDSQLSNAHSDLRSLVSGLTVAVSASDISDIVSAVDAILASRLSDILSAAGQTNSRVLVTQSMASDVYSLLSDLNSNLLSRIPAEPASRSQLSDLVSDVRSLVVAGVGVTASGMSDIASRVWADAIGARVDSRLLVALSTVSDIRSHVSDLQSDFQSRVPKRVATDSQLSDVHSDLKSAIGAIAVTLTASDVSDIASAVHDILASRLSDILSAAVQTNSRVLLVQSLASDIRSHVSDLQSDFQSRVPKLVATNSQLSDVHSDLKSAIGGLTVALTASDISDIASAVAAAVTTITTSDISDIASRVDAVLASRLSDILSAAQQANSRLLVNQSAVSDIASVLSNLDSNFESRVPKRVATDSQVSALASDIISALAAGVPVSASDMSDIRSAIAAGTLTASTISDIASAVALELASSLSDVLSAAQQGNSRLLVAQSYLSDIRSHVSDLQSDFQSRVPKRVATDSQLSDVHSDLRSQIGGITVAVSASDISDIASAVKATLASDFSDMYSAATQISSRALVNQSRVSDIYSLLSDLESNFESRVPKRVATDSQLSDLASDIKSAVTVAQSMASDAHSAAAQGSSRALAVQSQASDIYSLLSDVGSDLGVLSGVLSDVHSTVGQIPSTGWDKLAAHVKGVLKVVVGIGSTSTAVVLNASTGIDGGAPSATNDLYNGRVIVFTSGALMGSATDITDYVGSTGTLTVTALTSAPSAGDIAVIV